MTDRSAERAPIAVRETARVPLTPAAAFDLFTEGIGEWWPLREGYSYGGDRAAQIFLEPFVGGRFYERFIDGDEIRVGTVLLCEPPDRIVFDWNSPEWTVPTEVEVRFEPTTTGTTVHVEHRGFERLGTDGAAIAERWRNGWPGVVSAFATRAGA